MSVPCPTVKQTREVSRVTLASLVFELCIRTIDIDVPSQVTLLPECKGWSSDHFDHSYRTYTLYPKNTTEFNDDELIVGRASLRHENWISIYRKDEEKEYLETRPCDKGRLTNPCQLELSWIAIAAPWEKRGIGTDFLAYVLRDVEANWHQGEKGLFVTDVSDHPAFYTRAGFSPRGGGTYRSYLFKAYNTPAWRAKEHVETRLKEARRQTLSFTEQAIEDYEREQAMLLQRRRLVFTREVIVSLI